jgi:hypothetical protein
MRVEHVFLFFLYFVASLKCGILHDSDDIFVVFVLKELLLRAI